MVFVTPVFDIVFPHVVHGADQFHPGPVGAFHLGHHGAYLAAVDHAHETCFDDIVEVMAQRNFIAAHLLGVPVQKATAHFGTQIARVLFHVRNRIKYFCIKKKDRNVKQRGIKFDLLPVSFCIARIHAKELHFKGNFVSPLQFLEQLCHEHGIFAAGNADGDFIIGAH